MFAPDFFDLYILLIGGCVFKFKDDLNGQHTKRRKKKLSWWLGLKFRVFIFSFFLFICIPPVWAGEFFLAKVFGDTPRKEFLHKITFDLEIDGKPYKISRTIWCWVDEDMTSNGEIAYRYPDYYAFGEKIADGGAIIVNIPNMCNRRKWPSPKSKEWVFEKLPDDYLPTIYLADNAEELEVLEEYSHEINYKSPVARVKYKGIKVEKAEKGRFFNGADKADRYSGYVLKPTYQTRDLEHKKVYEKIWYAEILAASFFDELEKVFSDDVRKGVQEIGEQRSFLQNLLQEKGICEVNKTRIYKSLPYSSDEDLYLHCSWRLYPFYKGGNGEWQIDKEREGIVLLYGVSEIREGRNHNSDTWKLKFSDSDPMKEFIKKPTKGFGFVDWENQKIFWIYPGYYQRTIKYTPSKEDINERIR